MEQDEIKKRIDFWNKIQDEFKIEILKDGNFCLFDDEHHRITDFKICNDRQILELMFHQINKNSERKEYNRIRSMFDEVKKIQNGWSETE